MPADFLSQIRTTAQEGIARRMYAATGETDAELRALGTDISTKCGCQPIFGPVKDRETAGAKVARDYGGDWLELKDAVRMTIVAPSAQKLKMVQAMIRARCVPSNRMGLIKDVETSGKTDPCGYSGLNFVVRLTSGRPAEIQANIPEVMYCKMSERSFTKIIGMAVHQSLKGRYRVQGGLGHGLYEIYRVSPGSVNGRRAALLSRAYYDYLRGIPDMKVSAQLQGELDAFVKAHHAIFAH